MAAARYAALKQQLMVSDSSDTETEDEDQAVTMETRPTNQSYMPLDTEQHVRVKDRHTCTFTDEEAHGDVRFKKNTSLEDIEVDDVVFSAGRNESEERLLPDEDELAGNHDSGSDEQGKEFTVEQAVEKIGFGWFQVKIICICGLFSASDALEMMLLAVLSPILRCDWQLSDYQIPLITTVVFIGMFSMSHIWGSWSDKYGRLPILVLSCMWILYFGLLTSFSPNFIWVLILRGLVGAGFGGAVQSFTLMSEYLPSTYRAKLLTCYQVFWATGSAFEILMAAWIIPTWGWRWLVAVSALPSLITVVLIWTLPESARYLVAAGKQDKALAVLQKAAKINKKTLPPGKLKKASQGERGEIKDLFNNEYRRTTAHVWLLWFGTAFTYYGLILASSEILEFHKVCGAAPITADEVPLMDSCKCNLLSWRDYKTMIISTFGEFLSIPLNLLTIDWLGRKWTITYNFFGAGLFFILIQICTSRGVLTFFIFAVRTFANGIFNSVYIYTSEVYPTVVRSLGLGSGSAMARIGAMLTPFVAQWLLRASVAGALWVYGAIALICTITSATLPIETRGREMPQLRR